MSANNKYTTIHYQSYLALETLLNAQHARSGSEDIPAAHEETLFIIVHQVYELWFKQVIHELESVLDIFDNQKVKEREMGLVTSRLRRVEKIFNLMVKQIDIMETMTPLDFLDFRSYLFPASGFQSFQFRLVEVLLGLPEPQRLTYHGQKYSSVFTKEQQQELSKMYQHGTLLDYVNAWLERTPFLNIEGFDFLQLYRAAVEKMIDQETAAIEATDYLSDKYRKLRLDALGNTKTYFQSILNEDVHNQLLAEGKKRLSYKATLAALFINLYREEPMLSLPFQLITCLIEIDNQMTAWRFRHAQMVLRMIGNKIGTGGSSGHEYLSKTTQQHQIYADFHHISTLLIPRSDIPPLPDDVKHQLSFHFNVN